MHYIDNFSKSIMWLLSYYDDAPCKLNKDLTKGFLCDFTWNGEFVYTQINGDFNNISSCKLFGKFITHKDSEFIADNDAKFIMDDNDTDHLDINNAYLLAIFFYIYDFKYNINNFSAAYEIDTIETLLSDAIGLNAWISTILINYDLATNKKVNHQNKYNPNLFAVTYLQNICKVQKFIIENEGIIDFSPSSDTNVIWDTNYILDKSVLLESFAFIQILAVLILMERSPFYKETTRAIAREILYVFKQLLVNYRIKKIIIDPNILGKDFLTGPKSSTAFEIFFALDNLDRYCLRFDFPHEGAEYIHYNLHELGHTTGLPLSLEEYKHIQNMLGDLKNLFFVFDNQCWFKNNFERKIQNYFSDDEELACKKFLLSLFHAQAHYHSFNIDVDTQDVKNFLNEFGCVLSQMSILGCEYQNTNTYMIDNELERIKLKDILLDLVEKYQILFFKEKIKNINLDVKKERLKTIYLDALYDDFDFENLSNYPQNELQDMTLQEVIMIIADVILENSCI